LIVGPKDEERTIKANAPMPKKGLSEPVGVSGSLMSGIFLSHLPACCLSRVLVAKVANMERLDDVVQGIPAQQGKPGWNSVLWVQEVLQGLKEDSKALGTSIVDWKEVRDAAMSYVQRKKDEHRFNGEGDFDMHKAPTFDLIEGKETVR
jgi:hypothetical protein